VTARERLAWLAGGTFQLRPWLALLLSTLLAFFAAASSILFLRVRDDRMRLRLAERAAEAALAVQQRQLDECLIQVGPRPGEKPGPSATEKP
jgi:hypothetical protein